MRFRLEMISQIVEIERQLASTKFEKSGCIYFRDDVPENISGDSAIITSVSNQSTVLKRFKLGPLVSSGLWRGERAGMDMNRGPCESPIQYNPTQPNWLVLI